MESISSSSSKNIPIWSRLQDPWNWYNRQVTSLFNPLTAQSIPTRGIEISARLVKGVALLFFSWIQLFILGPVAFVGFCINSESIAPQSPSLDSNSFSTDPITRDDTIAPPPRSEPSEKLAGKSAVSDPEDSTPSLRPATQKDYAPPPAIEGIPEAIVAAMQSDAQKIEDMINGVQKSNSDNWFLNITDIRKKVGEFLDKYGRYRQKFSPEDQYSPFFTVDSAFKIAILLDQLFKGILPILKDGNCFFHSILDGLRRLGIDVTELSHEKLRKAVVQWMKEHYEEDEHEELRVSIHGGEWGGTYLLGAIPTYIDIEREKIRKELHEIASILSMDTIPQAEKEATESRNVELLRIQSEKEEEFASFNHIKYFEYMEQLGHHASRAEMYAVSKLFNINIKICRDLAHGLDDNYDLAVESPENHGGTITLVLNEVGNHFDLRSQ